MSALEFVFVAQLLISLMLSVVFFLVWRTVDRKPHALSWCLVFLVSGVNTTLNAARGAFPSNDVYWVTVNALSLTTQALALAGFSQRAGVRLPWRGLTTLLVAAAAVVVYFTYVRPHMGLKMVVIPYVGTLTMLACAWLVSRAERRLRAAEWGAISVLVLYGLSQFAAGTVAVMQGAFRDEVYLSLYSRINFLSMPAAFTGLGVFGVLLIADDLADEMRTLALTDRLTGVMNRRGFEASAERAVAVAIRSQEPLCLAVVDLDHFKEVNDGYGHAAGDRALHSIARTLEAGLRSGDIVGRLGGEEFALVFPATELSEAEQIARRLRQQIESSPMEIEEAELTITASFGLAQVDGEVGSLRGTLEQADAALYRAKTGGRNRVEVIRAPGSSPRRPSAIATPGASQCVHPQGRQTGASPVSQNRGLPNSSRSSLK